jgi:putative restriction endonuclease
MKFYLGVTDTRWYDYLSTRSPEDVNFWQPGENSVFRVLPPWGPFLFKLKHPKNAIGGVGFFASHTRLPLSVAWETFGTRNGCDSFQALREMILRYRKNPGDPNPSIGCIVLTNPVFFRPSDWIPTPENWGKSIVQGKSYTDEEPVGRALWEQVQLLLTKYMTQQPATAVVAPESTAFSTLLTRVRLGQGAFRVMVTDAYTRRCSISGEKTLPVLEAAHIRPFAQQGPHALKNGILLRSDIHKLFDTGYVTITPELKVEVSSRIRQEFENGREYYQYHGRELAFLPPRAEDRPSPEFIDWHNVNIYKG